MRRKLRYIVVIAIILFAIFLVFKIWLKLSDIKKSEKYIKTFSYVFNLSNGAKYEFRNTYGKPFVIVFFNPGCEHCEYEGNVFQKNHKKIDNAQFILVSLSPKDSIVAYSKRYGLDTLPNFHFATDSLLKAHSKFGVRTIPTIFIYGKDGKLRKRFTGEVKIEAIIRELNK